ncbi:MAG: hypothetical protein KBS41_03145, partial [Oscillospiraceae bacterium]|nr:hypothetical protein [Candidatus Equicaccousia limihippi]
MGKAVFRPLAVCEKIFGLTLNLDFFDRCANLCSLHPPPAALANVARRATNCSTSRYTSHTGCEFLHCYYTLP